MSIFVGHKPNRQHIQALMACRHEDALLDLFETALAETKNSLVEAQDEVRVRQLQGTATALQDFLDSVRKSDEVMERLNSRS